ncbi:MAG: tRNA (guanosine(46)-N7)-methyltransferase TrmB [Synechococcaceae cyanobacterium]|nr:tRNA (guanosine(46)-N7)-methyltransferase TrmB [Synechococcaceae cyanobacterium]
MVRQHVNPLSRYYQLPRSLPSPEELFADPERPLHLDLGSARGRFLLAIAPLHPERNHLGLEIRRSLVAAAEADRQSLGLTNLAFQFANANISLPAWLEALPPGRLELVSLQFPDPWFKRKHHKRRVLQPGLLRALALALAPGRQLFLQSDVLELITPMRALVEASGCFDCPGAHDTPWLPHNPLPLPTERERHVLAQGLPVWRVLFRRNDAPVPPLERLEHDALALEFAEQAESDAEADAVSDPDDDAGAPTANAAAGPAGQPPQASP